GSEMAFIRQVGKSIEFHLLVANADGSGERIILTRSGHQGLSSAGPAWSPDGKLIAFGDVDLSMRGGEGNCLITGIELQNGAVKALSSERWDNCYRSAWTPDGRGIVFIGTRTGESLTTRRDQIYYLSIADGKSRRLSTETHRYLGGSLGITADNSLLVVPHKVFSQIWTMSADGDVGTAVQLTSGQKDGFTGIAPLPDGRIGYITWTGENRSIWIMDPDGSNQRQINDQMPFVEALRATPDGRFFIFSARKHGFSHLYRIDTDGQNLKQLTDGESHEVGSTVSPDSSWVYHGSNAFDGQIWRTYVQRTSIDGGRTTTLKEIDASGLIPHVSPDGKSITCATHSGLKIYSTEDGSVQYSLETDKGAGWWTGAKWTPDGRSITYLVSRNKNINVWVQPIDGSSPPGPLTQFPKDHVYSHAFSSDGERLYVARGYQVSDAVLVRNSY
ncbi:MAG TPA: DPP IV N-terminal domain-containing protein, partial [Pyrinomonadaceae bacterium]|nr:DPP IV N-terminal domain-containing protein [Pyrinomonadaceae bacterium]